MRARAAVTLVEIAIAFAVLGLALVPLLSLFSSAGRQARQTSDYGLAIALETKVADEMRTAAWEDVHYGDELVADQVPLAAASLVDGASPFFDAIEDDARPYGRIVAKQDAPVTPAAAALYRALRTFRAGAQLTGDGQAREVVSLELALQWEDFQQVDRALAIPVGLPRNGLPGEAPEAVADRARADDAIRRLLYATGGTLADAVAQAGGDLETVRAAGDVVLVGSGLAADRAQKAAAAAPLEAGNDAHARIGLARIREAEAASSLSAILYLAGPLASLAASYQPEKLGRGAAPVSGFRIAPLGTLADELAAGLTRARIAYAQAYSENGDLALPPRPRQRAFMKYVDLTKLALVIGGGDVAPLRDALSGFASAQAGRNPNLERYARWELDHARDLDAVRAAYPGADRLAALRTFADAVGPALAKLGATP